MGIGIYYGDKLKNVRQSYLLTPKRGEAVPDGFNIGVKVSRNS
jgi:hypothetical protein